MPIEYYHAGVIPKVTLHLDRGNTLDIENSYVEILVDRDVFEHYTMGVETPTQVVIGEKKTIKISVDTPEKFYNLMRLIRED